MVGVIVYVELRKRRIAGRGSCYYGAGRDGAGRWWGEVQESGWLRQVEGGQDGLVRSAAG